MKQLCFLDCVSLSNVLQMISKHMSILRIKNSLYTFIFSLISLSAVSQTTICLGDDITVCVGTPVTIEDCNPGQAAANAILLDNPTEITLSDDQWGPAVPIGFNFSFYGNNYNQCVIGSNGVISFNLGNANGYCPWALGGVGPLPTPGFAAALNSQMPAYHDMNPGAWASPGGEILYQTIGTAPNRRFVVLYKDIFAFGGGGECTYMGVIMNETQNSFEFHIGWKPIAAGWNGGLAIQGSQNNTGTVAHITPGRNNQQWTASQEAKIWTPTSPSNTSNYVISNIPYVNILSPNSTFAWGNTATAQTWPYNNGELTVDPTLPGTTGYFLTLQAQGCSNSIGGASDTTYITGVSSQVNATMTPDICSAGLGSVTATPLVGTPPFVFNWPALGSNSQTVNNVYAGTYFVQMTDGIGCPSTANVTVTDTPAQYTNSSTVVSCPGGNDGTATANMVPIIGNVTYLWDDPMAQTTSTATGLAAGTYNCTITSDVGCSNIIAVTVTEIPGMTAVISTQTNATCNSGNDGVLAVTVNQGTAPYSYSWDNSTSTTNIANDLSAGTHTCTITDANGCVITISGTIGEPAALNVDFITPNTQICPEDDITLTAVGSGGSSPYTFTWYENGVLIGTGIDIVVDPTNTNTQYCVELSEACGSPIDSECTLIYFPTPIVPSAIPDEIEKCVPGFFEFTNTSSNSSEIASTVWNFGQEELYVMEIGNDSTSLTFTEVGTYNLTMTITSIHGCVYEETINSIMEVLPTPTADFNFSANPATIFETTVFMQDKSSVDVTKWTWFSPYSNPTTSTSQDPAFIFPEGVPGTYPVTLAVETDRGCVDTVTYNFNVVEDILFYAPNSFTPDGDEHNQSWRIEVAGIDIYNFDLFIFNRWGELIWESHDPSAGWDGTYGGQQVPAGMYVWRARVQRLNNDDRQEFNGMINVLR
jgi:gliding motility-associated-like protein